MMCSPLIKVVFTISSTEMAKLFNCSEYIYEYVMKVHYLSDSKGLDPNVILQENMKNNGYII
jgi:hypothetical protein